MNEEQKPKIEIEKPGDINALRCELRDLKNENEELLNLTIGKAKRLVEAFALAESFFKSGNLWAARSIIDAITREAKDTMDGAFILVAMIDGTIDKKIEYNKAMEERGLDPTQGADC